MYTTTPTPKHYLSEVDGVKTSAAKLLLTCSSQSSMEFIFLAQLSQIYQHKCTHLHKHLNLTPPKAMVLTPELLIFFFWPVESSQRSTDLF